MAKEIERYLGRLEARLKDKVEPERLQQILDETETHLYEDFEARQELGDAPDLATRLTLKCFGDEREFAQRVAAAQRTSTPFNQEATNRFHWSLAFQTILAVVFAQALMIASQTDWDLFWNPLISGLALLFAYVHIKDSWYTRSPDFPKFILRGLFTTIVLAVANTPFFFDYGTIDGRYVGSRIYGSVSSYKTLPEEFLGSLYFVASQFGPVLVFSLVTYAIVSTIRHIYEHLNKPNRKVKA